MNRTAAAISLTTSLAVLSMATSASALSLPGHMGMGMGRHGIVGQVAAVSGTSLSVESRSFSKDEATTTYSVDASNATIYKDNATSSLSAIAAGDIVMVQGTVNGTSVTAKVIRDGLPAGKWQGKPGGPRPNFPEISGNGQPVIGGSISAISGSTLTVGTKAGTSFTVDASGATVVKGNATSSLASLAVGDSVVVQGSVNGSNVTASSVIAGGVQRSVNVSDDDHPGFGFLGGIGGFLHRIFGFF